MMSSVSLTDIEDSSPKTCNHQQTSWTSSLNPTRKSGGMFRKDFQFKDYENVEFIITNYEEGTRSITDVVSSERNNGEL